MNDINSIGNARLIIREVSKVIVGKDESLIKILLAVIAGGHILMEDIPGVGKTTMAISVSKALGLDYNRVQFTPDVLPSDITGFSIYDKETGKMNYQKGAVLWLQAMEEGIVTVDNHTYPVPKPFIVIATQNPTGAKGTQMLPDSQMDRFMLRLSMGYPSHDDEIEMIRRKQKGVSTETVQEVVSRDELMRIRKEADQVYVKDEIIDYIVRLCDITRNDGRIIQGASPRASLALTALSKATAWIQGRDYVLPKDIRFVFSDCIEHRLIWSQEMPDAAAKKAALQELFSSVPAPRIS